MSVYTRLDTSIQSSSPCKVLQYPSRKANYMVSVYTRLDANIGSRNRAAVYTMNIPLGVSTVTVISVWVSTGTPNSRRVFSSYHWP